MGAMAALAGAGYLAFASRPPRLNQATLCPLDGRPGASTLLVVDTTDPLTRVQAARLAATIRDARDSLPAQGRLTILFLDAANAYDPREILSLCNPGSIRDSNPFTQTAKRVERRWREAFEAPVESAIESLLRAPAASRSPIVETIAAATARPDFDARNPNRRLLVVSDMLQHTNAYSHYAGRMRWESFAQSRLAPAALADLTGATVEVEYIRRPGTAHLQTEAHRSFWLAWFERNGATSVRFLGVPEPQRQDRLVAQRRDQK